MYKGETIEKQNQTKDVKSSNRERQITAKEHPLAKRRFNKNNRSQNKKLKPSSIVSSKC